MNILQLTPQFPFPADDGGKISIANIYNTLLELNSNVIMVSISQNEVSDTDIEKYKRNGQIEVIVMDTRNTITRIIKHFITNKSLYIEKHYFNNLANLIEARVDMNEINVIHVDHSNMAKIGIELSRKYKIPIGLRLHNVEYMIWKRYYEELGFLNPKKLFIGQQYKLLLKEESNFLNQVDVAFSITKKDRDRAIEIAPKSNVIVATAGVNLSEWKSDENITKVKNSLVIATTFNWVHNINALRWFLNNVQPILKKNFNNLTLNIIGKNPPKEFEKFSNLGVKSLGYVDDVKPYLNKSEIYIAPLFVGSGIRIKILEAMAMGLPVVATDISAEGIDASESDGLFRANTSDEYISVLNDLLNNKNELIFLSVKAREYIKINHTWEKNVSIMLNQYQGLIFSRKNKA